MPCLEFSLPPAELPRLLRQPGLRQRGGRPAPVELTWHDTAGNELAGQQLSLCQDKAGWRLERASPRPGEAWPPGTPAPCLAEAADLAGLGPELPRLDGPLAPVAGFRGQRRTLQLDGDASLAVLHGTLRGMAREQPSCRVLLTGPAPGLAALSTHLAETVALAVPRWSLAAEAAAFARDGAPPDRRSGGPEVPPGTTVTDAAALVIGHLTDVILAGVDAAGAGEAPEAVHATRVAVRRLRSALSVFRRAIGGPETEAAKAQLHELAGVLGGARDWDVFLAGIGQDVAAALPEDPRIARMAAAAGAQREAAYGRLRHHLASAPFRRLAVALVQLAALRPWEADADEARAAKLSADAAEYAAASLGRQHGHMLNRGPDISALPAGELHDLRKRGKRLRYAAEFFAPLHGRRSTRRFVRAVSRLQEELGRLNDGAAAAELMDRLPGGSWRQFAAGAVQGFAAARSTDARAGIARGWTKFRRADPFWD